MQLDRHRFTPWTSLAQVMSGAIPAGAFGFRAARGRGRTRSTQP